MKQPNNMSILNKDAGVIGSIERILPERIIVLDEGTRYTWSAAVGMIRTAEVDQDFRDLVDKIPSFKPDMLSTMIITKSDSTGTEVSQYHGVMFFKPMESMRWQEQVRQLKEAPHLFEVVPSYAIDSAKDYAFFARVAQNSKHKVRGKL